ncbi:hypothetical protein J7J00_22265 [Bacillus sp. ISL-4]|uniref:hypothetical protein n=2 Tax=unclassified Bacillus (in: firmicutes) TaxID=185979 RepID=UPI001BE7ABE5|nr:hypothetical protein [Bacillus sp. ISL-4]MBT2668170.1 hypothetical protein [Bacillus sp. ISL-4]
MAIGNSMQAIGGIAELKNSVLEKDQEKDEKEEEQDKEQELQNINILIWKRSHLMLN